MSTPAEHMWGFPGTGVHFPLNPFKEWDHGHTTDCPLINPAGLETRQAQRRYIGDTAKGGAVRHHYQPFPSSSSTQRTSPSAMSSFLPTGIKRTAWCGFVLTARVLFRSCRRRQSPERIAVSSTSGRMLASGRRLQPTVAGDEGRQCRGEHRRRFQLGRRPLLGKNRLRSICIWVWQESMQGGRLPGRITAVVNDPPPQPLLNGYCSLESCPLTVPIMGSVARP